MDNGWFVMRGTVKSGPYSSSQLKAMADSGQLKPSDLVARRGMAQWAESSKVKGLFSALCPVKQAEPPRLEVAAQVTTKTIPQSVEPRPVSKEVTAGLTAGLTPGASASQRAGVKKKFPAWAWMGVAFAGITSITFTCLIVVGLAVVFSKSRNSRVTSQTHTPSSSADLNFNSFASSGDSGVDAPEVENFELVQTLPGSNESEPLPSQVTHNALESSGDGAALQDTGHNYFQGLGVEQDYLKAAAYYQMAIDAGNNEASNDLGYMYVKGLGVAEDHEAGAALFYKAASNGSAMAMFNYGLCLSKGVGVDQNEYQSRLWIQRSSEAGYKPAQDYIAQLQNQMGVQLLGAVLEGLFSSGGGGDSYSQSNDQDYYTERQRQRDYWEDRTRRAEAAGDQMDADYSRRQIP